MNAQFSSWAECQSIKISEVRHHFTHKDTQHLQNLTNFFLFSLKMIAATFQKASFQMDFILFKVKLSSNILEWGKVEHEKILEISKLM